MDATNRHLREQGLTDATIQWVQEHGFPPKPDRNAALAEIIAPLRSGFSINSVLCWDWEVAPTPDVPMPVAINLSCAYVRRRVLNGLFPPECDLLLHFSPEEDLSFTIALEEMCAVATLATLVHQRGVTLDERTVLYLHGITVLFGQRILSPPAYALAPLFERKAKHKPDDWCKSVTPKKPRVSLFQCVKDFGWDETADYLAKEQERIWSLATGRRPRGRPKKEEFDKWASERFAVVGEVGQVVKEAVANLGLKPDTLRKRITRSVWFRRMAPAPAFPAHQPVLSSPPGPGSTLLSLAEVIEKYIAANGPRGDLELAAQLGFDLQKVKKALRDPDRFQYKLGHKWDVFR